MAPATSNANDVAEGSVIRAVHMEMWILGGGATTVDTQFIAQIEKVSSGASPATFANMLNLGAYANKKNILWTSQGVVGASDTNSIPIIRDWLLIPKGKQRFGAGDRLVMTVATVETTLQHCGLFVYKEYK